MRLTLTFLFTMYFMTQSWAQGVIKGFIYDETSQVALEDVTIFIKGQEQYATYSGADGSYEMKAPEGNHLIVVRYIGYQPKEIADVKITNNQILDLKINLAEEKKVNQLKSVVVRSTLKKETINAIYITQKNAATVSDGISAEVIKKSPDRSTGDVLKRVSGTTIQDNKFVIIRGLTDRYNTALLDNTFLPSTEANRKAFSFDIIPASLIDNIIISKSGTPDLPADFAGGVINILTKEIPEKNFNTFSVGTSYNTASTFKQFQTGKKSSTDFLGFDNRMRQLPTSMPSYDQLAGKNLTKQQSINYLGSLNNNLDVNNRKGLPAINLSGSLGRVYLLPNNKRLGITTAINYAHSESAKRNVERVYGNYNYLDQIYNYNTTIGALANIAYSTANSKISLKNLYNRTFDDSYLYREGYDGAATQNIKYYAFDVIQKALFKTSLEGEHNLGKDREQKINWVASYNFVSNNQPDQRKVQFQQFGLSGDYLPNLGTVGRANNRLFGDLKESIVNMGVNYSIPYDLKFLYKSNLKVGALALYRNRDFSNRYFGATLSGTGALPENPTLNNLFTNENIQNGTFDFIDQTNMGDMYSAKAYTTAAYVMSDNRITTKLRAVWGARFESYHLDLKSPILKLNNQIINPTWNDVLPSMNLSYALTEKSNLRLSYFKSIARPELREIAPMGYYDYELNLLINGNENLTRSRINNFDFRYELFSKPGEVLSGSVFYKQFDKTIENSFLATGSPEVKTVNYDKAYARGIELELRKNLGFMAKNTFLEKVSFYANVSIIQSKVNLSGKDTLYLTNSSRHSRALSGQSPYVINTSLNYMVVEDKLNFSVLYNRIGQRIFIVGGNGQFGDIYETPRNILDFQVAYTLKNKHEFKLNVRDALNSRTFFYYDQNNNKQWNKVVYDIKNINPNQDYILQRYKQGTTFSLTYSYKF
jgi:TonB-dependent receptor